MKHVLLGSTALVAASLVAGTAWAEEPVKLEVKGFYQAAMGGLIDEDGQFDSDTRNYSVETNGEVRFLGETTLDNGLTVGARVEMEAFNSADQIDQAYAFLSGGFGEVRLGDTLEALSQMCYLAPQAGSLFGADSPNFNFSNAGVLGYGATNGTCYGLAGESSSIIYFSPSFGGFSFAASFAPEASDSFGGGVANLGLPNFFGGTSGTLLGSPSTEFDNHAGQLENIFSVAASFSHDFNGFSLVAGGAASFAGREASSINTEDYNAYLNFGFGGWTVGGAFEYRDDISGVTNDIDNWVGSVGTTYNWDAWTVGLTWSHGEYDVSGPGDDDNYEVIQFTGAYALGPGITLEGMVGYNDYNDDGTNAPAIGDGDYEAIEVGAGIGINF
jgi:hypothetical protein